MQKLSVQALQPFSWKDFGSERIWILNKVLVLWFGNEVNKWAEEKKRSITPSPYNEEIEEPKQEPRGAPEQPS